MTENTPLYPLKKGSFTVHSAVTSHTSSRHPFGVLPSRLLHAYGTDRKALDANGIKIAVVTSFENPTINHDLSVFCRENSFDMPKFSVVRVGSDNSGTGTPSWTAESCLDVQWITSTAPGGEIICVTAENALTQSLMEAAEIATELEPDVVCMCFGTPESQSIFEYDKVFRKKGIVFLASSGDTGSVTSFPSVCPDVLSVGGTSLEVGIDGKRLTEYVWQNSGSGISEHYMIPCYQKKFSPVSSLTNSMRGTPDVSFCASIENGAGVYCSPLGGWITLRGTSLACACMAGISACLVKAYPEIKERGINDFLYSLAGEKNYAEPQYYFYDIVLGSNGKYKAVKGWDLCSGLGVVKNLIFSSVSPT